MLFQLLPVAALMNLLGYTKGFQSGVIGLGLICLQKLLNIVQLLASPFFQPHPAWSLNKFTASWLRCFGLNLKLPK